MRLSWNSLPTSLLPLPHPGLCNPRTMQVRREMCLHGASAVLSPSLAKSLDIVPNFLGKTLSLLTSFPIGFVLRWVNAIILCPSHAVSKGRGATPHFTGGLQSSWEADQKQCCPVGFLRVCELCGECRNTRFNRAIQRSGEQQVQRSRGNSHVWRVAEFGAELKKAGSKRALGINCLAFCQLYQTHKILLASTCIWFIHKYFQNLFNEHLLIPRIKWVEIYIQWLCGRGRL